MTTILSPAGAVESLLKSGVRVSERELRAKAKRIKAKHLGIRKASSFATNRNGPFKAKIGGGVVRRDEE